MAAAPATTTATTAVNRPVLKPLPEAWVEFLSPVQTGVIVSFLATKGFGFVRPKASVDAFTEAQEKKKAEEAAEAKPKEAVDPNAPKAHKPKLSDKSDEDVFVHFSNIEVTAAEKEDTQAGHVHHFRNLKAGTVVTYRVAKAKVDKLPNEADRAAMTDMSFPPDLTRAFAYGVHIVSVPAPKPRAPPKEKAEIKERPAAGEKKPAQEGDEAQRGRRRTGRGGRGRGSDAKLPAETAADAKAPPRGRGGRGRGGFDAPAAKPADAPVRGGRGRGGAVAPAPTQDKPAAPRAPRHVDATAAPAKKA